MRRLDRDRPYGYLFPIFARRAFVQDDIVFDQDGVQIDPPAAVSPVAPVQAPLPKTEGVPASRPTLALKPVTVEKKSDAILSPRTEREWQTFDFPKLRRGLKKDFGVEVLERKAALRVLRERNLIKGS